MDSFRLILILIGLAIVAIVYLLGRQRRKADREDLSELERAFEQEFAQVGIRGERQRVSDEQLTGLSGIKSTRGPVPVVEQLSPPRPDTRDRPEATLLVLTVMAASTERPFSGAQLSNAFDLLGFAFGQMDIFHCQDADTGQSLFGIANIIEPGHFKQLDQEGFSTPGLALILALPCAMGGAQAFELMLNKARQLEEMLGGALCDQSRRRIDDKGLQALRDKAAPYEASESFIQ